MRRGPETESLDPMMSEALVSSALMPLRFYETGSWTDIAVAGLFVSPLMLPPRLADTHGPLRGSMGTMRAGVGKEKGGSTRASGELGAVGITSFSIAVDFSQSMQVRVSEWQGGAAGEGVRGHTYTAVRSLHTMSTLRARTFHNTRGILTLQVTTAFTTLLVILALTHGQVVPFSSSCVCV